MCPCFEMMGSPGGTTSVTGHCCCCQLSSGLGELLGLLETQLLVMHAANTFLDLHFVLLLIQHHVINILTSFQFILHFWLAYPTHLKEKEECIWGRNNKTSQLLNMSRPCTKDFFHRSYKADVVIPQFR